MKKLSISSILSLVLLLSSTLALLAQTPSVPSSISLYAPTPAPVTQMGASIIGTGPRTYTYFVIATYPIGKVVSAPLLVVGAANTLGGGNSVKVTWNSPNPAVTKYDVVRFDGQIQSPVDCAHCSVVTGTSNTSVTDTTATLAGSYTFTGLALPATATIRLDNTNYSSPSLIMSPPLSTFLGAYPTFPTTYGCVGDGVTDDSTCFQNAVNSLSTTGGNIVFTSPSYLINTPPASLPNNVQLTCPYKTTITLGSTLYMTRGDAIIGVWGGLDAGSTTLNGCIFKYGGAGAPTISLSGGTPTTAAVFNVVVSKGTYNSVVYNNSISAIDVLSGGVYATPPTPSLANVGNGTGATLGTIVMGLADTFTYSSGGTATGTGVCAVSFAGGGGDENATGIAQITNGVISTITVLGRGTNYQSVPTTATLSLPAWGTTNAATTCTDTINLAGGGLTVVSLPVIAIGSDYTNPTLLAMHDCPRCTIQNINIDMKNVTGGIGIVYDSDNAPATDLGVISQISMKAFHHGIVVGWDSETNGRDTNFNYCNNGTSQLGCAQADSLALSQVLMEGNCADTYNESIHVNSANALQIATLSQIEIECSDWGIHYVATNGTSHIQGLTVGSMVQPAGLTCSSLINPPARCSTMLRISHTVAITPSLSFAESESGSFAVVSAAESVTTSTSEWHGNQLNNNVAILGNERISSTSAQGSGSTFSAVGATGISGTYTYTGGVDTTCPANSTQTVLFTIPDAQVRAQGTIAINGAGTPTGAITILQPGRGYVIAPTQGTITNCNGVATFTAGTLAAYNVTINSDSESKWVSNTFLAATGCLSTKNLGGETTCGDIRTLTRFNALSAGTGYIEGSTGVLNYIASASFSVVGSAAVTGTAGQTCNAAFPTGPGGTATAIVVLSATNSLTNSTWVITSKGADYTLAPTTVTLSNGTANCSGAPTITSTLGNACSSSNVGNWFVEKGAAGVGTSTYGIGRGDVSYVCMNVAATYRWVPTGINVSPIEWSTEYWNEQFPPRSNASASVGSYSWQLHTIAHAGSASLISATTLDLPGGIQVNTAASPVAGDGEIMAMDGSNGVSLIINLSTGRAYDSGLIWALNSGVTSSIARLGFATPNSSTMIPVTGIYYRFDRTGGIADTDWMACSTVSSAESCADTGVAAGTGTVRGEIFWVASGVIGFQLWANVGGTAIPQGNLVTICPNGSAPGGGNCTVNATPSTNGLSPFAEVGTSSTVQQTLQVRAFKFKQIRLVR